MRVHIVCENPHTARILPRMSRYLAHGNGWTMSDKPDAKAELNYFLNYLVWRKWHWTQTPTAGYFTHKDTENAKKARWWDEAAAAIDIPIVTADMYADDIRKATYRAHAPVEVDRFTIAKRGKRARPVVGVSGYVYGDGRKGEALIEQLARSELARKAELRASGRGWAVKTHSYSWEQMPQFYQALDVLVCPSLMEGVPMPPLEAMACGVKVVIPENVGMLDELPDAPGIFRYKRGDASAMIEAVERAAFSDPVDRQALRNIITDRYTVDHWCADHERIFEHRLYDEYTMKQPPDWRGRAGVYIVAFGKPSRDCACTCITACKQQMPELPVALVGTEPLNAGEDLFIKQPDRDIGGRLAKLAVYDLAPKSWQYVLYLDADTEPVKPFGFLFDALVSGWEFVICKDMNTRCNLPLMDRGDNHDEYEITLQQLGTSRHLQFNGGVFAFRRCERMRAMFQEWQAQWQLFGKRDQGALIRALHKHTPRLYMLTNVWNESDRYEIDKPDDVIIWHHNVKARRYGSVPGRIDSPEAWAAVRKWEAANL